MRCRECKTRKWRAEIRLGASGECEPLGEVERVVVGDVVGEFMEGRRGILRRREKRGGGVGWTVKRSAKSCWMQVGSQS